jgi:23S rRNA (adenine2030-N6)-methyltransferase
VNYRHAFHAGNHADVVKHAVLARLLEHLKKKDKPFLALDAHAGIGIYDLASPEADKTGEWEAGIGRLQQPLADERAEQLLEPWRRAVASLNQPGRFERYPGSPEIMRLALRSDDRMVANELHPEDAESLKAAYGFDSRVRATEQEALTAVKANLPPPQRRGLILIDPPYEDAAEVERVLRMLREGLKRFATGIYMIWYPVTGDGLDERLLAMIAGLQLKQAFKAQVMVRMARYGGGLAGSGLAIVNPPWQLDEELRLLLPALAARLAQDSGAIATALAGSRGAAGARQRRLGRCQPVGRPRLARR